MSTLTTNFGFVKPTLLENASLTIWNDNLDAIDAEIKATQDIAHPQPGGFESWNWEEDTSIFSDTITDITFNWAAVDSEGNSHVDFNDAGNGQFQFNAEGVYRIIFNLAFTLPTTITSGFMELRIYEFFTASLFQTFRETVEKRNGYQTLNVDWLIDVRNSGTHFTPFNEYNFAVYHENSHGENFTVQGVPTDEYQTFVTFEYVRD